MPFSVDDTPFGSLSVTLADVDGTLSASIMATAPATLSLAVYGAPPGVPPNGTEGQILVKASDAAWDTEWVDVQGDYLPLTGGAMSYGAEISFNSEYSISEINGDHVQFQRASNSAEFSEVKYNAITVVDDAGNVTIYPGGIIFPDSSAQTTAFLPLNYYTSSVINSIFAPKASPVFTGNPTAPTAATGDNDTTIATTAFVQQELAAGTAIAKSLEVYVRNQTGATLTAGTIVYINGATGNKPTVTKAQANNDANSAQTFGFVKTSIANNGFGYVIVRGEVENLDTSALTEGQQLYLSPTTAGTWTTTKPYAPDHLVYVGICVRAHPTQGVILVAIQNGYELDEIHDVKITSPTNGQVLKYDSAQGLWVNGTDSAPVTSVAGRTGAVTLSNTDISGLGTMATATASDYLAKAGNLSGLTDLATSRSNLGLGTMAVETASNYLTTSAASSTYAPLASPALTGTPTAPTAAAATNTTQIATTAFVQQEVPAASTTAAGKVELATIGEALDGDNATLVTNVEDVQWMLMNNAYRPYFNVTGGTSGTGAFTNPVPPFRYEAGTPNTLTAGFAYLQSNNYSGMTVGQGGTVFDFSKKFWMSFHLENFNASSIGDANNEIKVFWGNGSNNGDDPTGKAVGVWKQGGSSSLWNLMVHDGTTLTKVATSSTTMPTNQIQRFMIYSNGAGTVKLFINGSEVASSNAGPTGTRTDTRFWFSVKQTASAATRFIGLLYYPKISATP